MYVGEVYMHHRFLGVVGRSTSQENSFEVDMCVPGLNGSLKPIQINLSGCLQGGSPADLPNDEPVVRIDVYTYIRCIEAGG